MSLIFDLELSILTGFTHTYPLCEVSMVLEYVFQECSVWSSYSVIFIGAVEILSASWSHHYQNWFIYTWVWKLFISQHQALAEAVVSLGQSCVGLNYYLLNETRVAFLWTEEAAGHVGCSWWFMFFCGCYVLSLTSDLFFTWFFLPRFWCHLLVVLPHVNEEARY